MKEQASCSNLKDIGVRPNLIALLNGIAAYFSVKFRQNTLVLNTLVLSVIRQR